MKHGVPQGSILQPLLFIICINDFPPTINTLSEFVIFADDSTVIISSKKFDDFLTRLKTVLSQMSKWFCANKFALNTDKK
jgi:hypothetical protein